MVDELVVRIGAGPTRPESKRAAIVRAATTLFLRQGYPATSTEQIATAAEVSKQTVYNQFGDKESLFREIVLGACETADGFAADVGRTLDAPRDAAGLEAALRALARRYLAAVLDPTLLALRRMVISEATRFPDLAAEYYARAPARVLDALADGMGTLCARGLLGAADPARAARDLAFLLVGPPLDEGMFRPLAPVDVDATADHAVDVLLAAYPSR